jgi:hypothetical protein
MAKSQKNFKKWLNIYLLGYASHQKYSIRRYFCAKYALQKRYQKEFRNFLSKLR